MIAIAVHGGAGGTSSLAQRGCETAVQVGAEILLLGGDALEAVLATAMWMEDSRRYNAGSGAIQKIDGSISMDAAVATSDGRLATVAAVPGVKNPVLFAYRLATRTTLVAVGGDEARKFAIEQLGLEVHPGPTLRVRQRHARMMRDIEAGKLIPPGWIIDDDPDEQLSGGGNGVTDPGHDTIGVVALDKKGVFALACSTGGSGAMIPGRIGDVPHRGAGFQIGKEGVVAATGIGEEILRRQGSDMVFDLIKQGLDPQSACEQVAASFPASIDVGFIALTREAIGIAANCLMASHSIRE